MSSSSATVRDGLKLPVDIIAILFDHAASLDPPYHGPWPPSTKWHTLGWITLTHVCRGWRDVGLAMPILWASIVTTFFDPAIANELLERACGCPITVELTARIWDRKRHKEGTLLPLIKEHLSQIGVLKLSNWALYDVLRSDNDKPLPYLHTLRIDDAYGYRRPIPLPTLQLLSPGLRSATFTNVILPPGSTSILRELTFTLTFRVQVSLSAVHEFLRCCPQLEMLSLKATGLSLRDEEYHASDVQLKKLKIARLSVDLGHTAWDLWRPIVAPDDIVLEIACEKRGSALSPSTPLILELCATRLSAEHHDVIEFRGNSMTLYQLSPDRSSSSSSCTLSISKLGHAQLLKAFPPFVRKENIRTLSLHSVSLVTTEADVVFPTLGYALPNVTDLSLKQLNHGPTSLYIRALGRRTSTGPIFPALQVLRLSDIDLNGKSSNPTRSTTQSWWGIVKAALRMRWDVKGEPLRCLVLEGTWPNAHKWDVDRDGEELRECRSRGLVQEIHDYRAYTL